MPTETKTERRIVVPDERLQDLFLETVKTLPIFVNVPHSEFRFAADGIEPSNFLERECPKGEYLSLCEEKKIKPFSRGRVEWDHSNACFVVRSIFGYDTSIEHDINGGITNVYEFHLDDNSRFRIFNSRELELLINKGYQMMAGDIWFDSFRGGCPESVIYKYGGIDMGTYKFNKGIKLSLPDIYDENEKSFLQNWFDQLRAKYERPSTPIS